MIRLGKEAARPMQVTFHRAIDMAADPVSAVHDVVRSGCDKILTSGGASTVLEGAATVRAMIRCAQGRRIDFIAASGVSEDNVLAILKVRADIPVLRVEHHPRTR